MSRAVMQQALEALEQFKEISDFAPALAVHAITALRAALAEPQTTHWEGCEAVHPECRKTEPVVQLEFAGTLPISRGGYAPTPRKPLTYDELEPLCEAFDSYDTTQNELVEFARAIERAYGIGGQHE